MDHRVTGCTEDHNIYVRENKTFQAGNRFGESGFGQGQNPGGDKTEYWISGHCKMKKIRDENMRQEVELHQLSINQGRTP